MESQETNNATPQSSSSPILESNRTPKIVVFDREFHVHESVLRIHSRWFRASIDWAKQQNRPETSQLWKHAYFSIVDGNGDDWALERLSTDSESVSDPNKLKNKPNPFNHYCDPHRRRCRDENHFLDGHKRAALDSEAFHKLLCTIYRMRTSITSVEELVTITRLADYYCALPTASSSIESSLLNETGLFYRHAEYMFSQYEIDEALKAATKLRNPVLFRELVVIAVSDWEIHIDPERFKEMDGKVRLVIVTAAHRISAMSNQARNELSRAARNPFTDLEDEEAGEIRRRLERYQLDHGTVSPYKSSYLHYSEQLDYLREIKSNVPGNGSDNDSENNSKLSGSALNSLMDILSRILKVNLRLSPIPELEDREGFFCAEVSDEELPWEATVREW
ncbi:hypothetical protein DID88_003704 [Monilinia fructigena]|uniref:BTB domain-containing protein n=1 Tax=Monilinia fructigena TaxID=38457 RepID=A0A395IU42_9HELO|nr:hypothetical protein DID88_003704 [Monilinia fructigena]